MTGSLVEFTPENEPGPAETPRSTKEPIKLKTNRKRQAEEEYKVIQGLAQNIAEKRQKKANLEKSASNPVLSFCKYVAQSLTELEPQVRHVAQHRISEILFQAQTGTLVQENQYRQPNRPQPQHFQSYPPQQHNFTPNSDIWRMVNPNISQSTLQSTNPPADGIINSTSTTQNFQSHQPQQHNFTPNPNSDIWRMVNPHISQSTVQSTNPSADGIMNNK